MGILHLSDVSTVLARVLKHGVERHLPSGRAVTVTHVPPGSVEPSSTNLVNAYLHHVDEPPQSRGADRVPAGVARSEQPLALVLHYAVTTHHGDQAGAPASDEEEFLFGLALKALHDHPWIDTSTRQPGSATALLLDGTELMADRASLELTVEPTKSEEALAFWTAAQRPPRPVGFVEIGVVEIRPEPRRPPAGAVVEVGLDLEPGFGPRLLGSRSTVVFTRPDSTRQTVDVEPAVVVRAGSDQTAAPAAAAPDPDPARFVLTGTHLGGEDRRLRLRSEKVSASLALDDPAPPLANQHWRPETADTGVAATCHPVLVDAESGASTTLTPGVYRVRVVSVEPPRAGGLPPTERPSNEVAVLVAPRITDLNQTGPWPWSLVVDGDDVGRTAGVPDNEIVLSVAGEPYDDYFTVVEPDSTGTRPPPPTTLCVMDLRDDRLALSPRAGSALDAPAAGTVVPVSLMINGVAAPPFWLVAP